MNSIAICEDDSFTLEKLEEMARCYIRSKGLHAAIRTFASGEELMQEPGEYDVVLLDLKLPGIDGVELAKKLGGRSRIIFVTAYKEYALDAFDVGAVHYLVKPVAKEQLFLALDRVRERLGQTERETLGILKNGVYERILLRDILYCEVFDHQLCVHTQNGCYEYFGTLDVLEEKLDGRFFRCHRSFLVNTEYVVRQEKGAAVLISGEKVPVSRRRQKEFRQSMLDFLKDEIF